MAVPVALGRDVLVGCGVLVAVLVSLLAPWVL